VFYLAAAIAGRADNHRGNECVCARGRRSRFMFVVVPASKVKYFAMQDARSDKKKTERVYNFGRLLG
jgi:hypothetical protein